MISFLNITFELLERISLSFHTISKYLFNLCKNLFVRLISSCISFIFFLFALFFVGFNRIFLFLFIITRFFIFNIQRLFFLFSLKIFPKLVYLLLINCYIWFSLNWFIIVLFIIFIFLFINLHFFITFICILILLLVFFIGTVIKFILILVLLLFLRWIFVCFLLWNGFSALLL